MIPEPKNTFTSKTFLIGAALGVWNMFIAPRLPEAAKNIVSETTINMAVNLLGMFGIGWARNAATTMTSFTAKPTNPLK